MKVVGTGSPTMLTIRVKSSEVDVLRDVVCMRQGELVEEAASVPARRGGAGDVTRDHSVERQHDELVLIAKLLEDLRRHVPTNQPREIIAPTWLLDPIIRDAATAAAERLSEAVAVFRGDADRLTADQLRVALDAACASTATLISLDHAQNHAMR